jgi:hypothetical protein
VEQIRARLRGLQSPHIAFLIGRGQCSDLMLLLEVALLQNLNIRGCGRWVNLSVPRGA